MEVNGRIHVPAALLPGEKCLQYALNRVTGGLQVRSRTSCIYEYGCQSNNPWCR
jgi:hypothetical protein